MRPSDVDVLIAGGGLAAQRTCETLRRLGYDGRVRLLCDERHAPYDRPPLSKAVLTGERGSETPSLRPARWYREHDVELMLGARASALDPAARRVDLEDGACLRYRQLVVATGSRPRRLPALPLGDAVRELRTIDDARALRQLLSGGVERLAIVGAGLIGMEVASSARRLGIAVTLIEAAPTPLARALPPTLGRWLAGLHERAGVEVLLERAVDRVRHDGTHVELALNDGHSVVADLVLVATGTVPATDWLADTGLGSAGAIHVDAGGRSALPGIYAAGDAACFPDPATGRHIPTQHWEAAAHQGAAVARAIVGQPDQAAQPPMFWSDQHGVRIQFVGHGDGAERIAVDGEPDTPDFTAWLIRGERPVGALLAGRARALADVRRRIAAPDGDAATALGAAA
jgi:3-phenylpropionate/trans-cinnamate dioxygenase ferredoxin reductase subunit